MPPFREAAWHDGTISTASILPLYTCGAIGKVLVETADAHPRCRFHVLRGHVHGEGEVAVRPNLVVKTQGACYGHPGYRLVTIRAGVAAVALPDPL